MPEAPFNTFGRIMRQHTLALEQMMASSDVRVVKMTEKIHQLRANALQMVESFHTKNVFRLVDPLIYEHLAKIGRFCDYLLIGGEGTNAEVIRKRMKLLNGMDHLKARVAQIQRLMDTNEMQWEIWPILFNFRQNKAKRGKVNQLVRQLGEKINTTIELIRNSSYYGERAFAEATGQLAKMTCDKSEDGAAKLDKLFQIVPKLMAEATQQMLRNLALDILRVNGTVFYSINFLLAFSNIVNGMERQCEELMRNSTFANAQQIVRNMFGYLKNEANGMFEARKVAIGAHFENIGKMLKKQMAPLKIELENTFTIHTSKRHKMNDGTAKEHKLFELLKEARNVFVIIQNALYMVDLQYLTEMVKQKLAKLEQLMKQDIVMNNNGGMISDEYELHDEISECLSTDRIEERLRNEIYILGYKMLF